MLSSHYLAPVVTVCTLVAHSRLRSVWCQRPTPYSGHGVHACPDDFHIDRATVRERVSLNPSAFAETSPVCTTRAQSEGAPNRAADRVCLRQWMASMVRAPTHVDHQGVARMTSK